MGLKRYKLGDLIEVTRGQSLAGEFYAEEGKYIRLTLGNFDYANGGFKPNTSKTNLYYTGPIKEQFILEEGDIITPLTEQTPGLLGSTARIPVSGTYIQSQDVALVRCKDGMLDPAFCYYLLPSSSVKKQLAAGAQQTKIRHTSPDKIKDVVVDIPDISEQRQMGQLLDAITHKIELNRSINQNLEALAKQLYDYWFVQFDFPDENGRPYKSSGGNMVWNEMLKREIPEGWESVPLSQYLETYVEKVAPKTVNSNDKYAPIEVIPRRRMSFCECSPIEKAISGLCRFKRKHILLSNRRVYFHKVCIAAFCGLTRDTVIVLRPSTELYLGYAYQLVNDDLFIEYSTRHSYGSEQPVLSWESAKSYKVLKPLNGLDEKYSKYTESVIETVLRNEMEIDALTKQRDEILPLLMNGQVSCFPQ